jgi:hypothetical protein
MNFLPAATFLFFLTHNCKAVSGAFCNWGPAGTGASSVCEGGAQGGEYCNDNENHCESGCGGRWCTSSGGSPMPPPSFCNWGPAGTGASSTCQGGAQGGEYCNDNENHCESGCGGHWCTGDGGGPSPPTGGGGGSPSPPTEVGGECPSGWNQASWTTYTSYAPCCQGSPNYDPFADRTECDLYSACDYLGQFAYSGEKSFNWVQNNNIMAFFSSYGDNTSFGNNMIRVSSAGKTVVALVADTCGDSDCNGCCSNNADPTGYLVDMEYWTVVNNFGDISAAQGQICWQLA